MLTGSSTVAPLLAEVGRRFEELHPAARIDVQTGGSGRGIADARAGLADFGMVSRALAADESDLQGVVLARDGVALIVHASNPLSELDSKTVRRIYTGAIGDWSGLQALVAEPLPEGEIHVVHKADGRATREVFVHHFGLETATIAADVIVGENEQGIKTVTGDPNAIGYVSIGAAEIAVEEGAPLRLLALDGVPADTAHLADGRYPVSRPLLLVSRGEPQGLAAALLAFARSEAVHDLVVEQGFVPVER